MHAVAVDIHMRRTREIKVKTLSGNMQKVGAKGQKRREWIEWENENPGTWKPQQMTSVHDCMSHLRKRLSWERNAKTICAQRSTQRRKLRPCLVQDPFAVRTVRLPLLGIKLNLDSICGDTTRVRRDAVSR